MKLKKPPQPLVFGLADAGKVCGAVGKLYREWPGLGASLCGYQGRYFLAVRCPLALRGAVRRVVGGLGRFLGPSPVLYSFFAEHGRELSRDILSDLGARLQ